MVLVGGWDNREVQSNWDHGKYYSCTVILGEPHSSRHFRLLKMYLSSRAWILSNWAIKRGVELGYSSRSDRNYLRDSTFVLLFLCNVKMWKNLSRNAHYKCVKHIANAHWCRNSYGFLTIFTFWIWMHWPCQKFQIFCILGQKMYNISDCTQIWPFPLTAYFLSWFLQVQNIRGGKVRAEVILWCVILARTVNFHLRMHPSLSVLATVYYSHRLPRYWMSSHLCQSLWL